MLPDDHRLLDKQPISDPLPFPMMSRSQRPQEPPSSSSYKSFKCLVISSPLRTVYHSGNLLLKILEFGVLDFASVNLDFFFLALLRFFSSFVILNPPIYGNADGTLDDTVDDVKEDCPE
jgi:hypothetical protein